MTQRDVEIAIDEEIDRIIAALQEYYPETDDYGMTEDGHAMLFREDGTHFVTINESWFNCLAFGGKKQ